MVRTKQTARMGGHANRGRHQSERQQRAAIEVETGAESGAEPGAEPMPPPEEPVDYADLVTRIYTKYQPDKLEDPTQARPASPTCTGTGTGCTVSLMFLFLNRDV